jgi:hypothetical protein
MTTTPPHGPSSWRASKTRGTRTLRNPWNLLVAGVGVGAAWAIGLAPGAAGLVGAGMLGVATVVSVARVTDKDLEAVQPATPRVRAGTIQSKLVNSLHDYRVNLEILQRAPHTQAVASTAVQATEAARAAETAANRIVRAVDKIDDAVVRADHIARQTSHSTGVQESVERMKKQRQVLLARLTTTVTEIGEVYAKLVELTTTAATFAIHADELSEARQVNETLDVIRGVFADLAGGDGMGRPPGPTGL